MLGVPIDGPTTMYGDNMSVVLNTTVPSSQLKKKHNAIAYHRVREAIAAKMVKLAHISSVNNVADILTKPLPVDAFVRLTTHILFRPEPDSTTLEPDEFAVTPNSDPPVTPLETCESDPPVTLLETANPGTNPDLENTIILLPASIASSEALIPYIPPDPHLSL